MSQPRPRRGRALAIAASAILHVAGAGALVVAGFWTIDPLPRPELAVVAAARLPAAAAAPAGASDPAPRVEPPKRRTRDTTQPRADRAPAEASAGSGGGDASGTGDGTGTGTGLGVTGLCADPTRCLGDVGSVPVTPPPAAPEIVPATLVEGRRIAGDPQIGAPEPVRAAMLRRGQTRLRATIKMCLDRRGAVDQLEVLASSGHAAYDRALLAGMRSWRYEPYRLRNAAVPVCTAVTFVYQMR